MFQRPSHIHDGKQASTVASLDVTPNRINVCYVVSASCVGDQVSKGQTQGTSAVLLQPIPSSQLEWKHIDKFVWLWSQMFAGERLNLPANGLL